MTDRPPRSRRPRLASIPLTVIYVKRPSGAVCGGCDWADTAKGAGGADLTALRRSAAGHVAESGHRVVVTLHQDIFMEPKEAGGG